MTDQIVASFDNYTRSDLYFSLDEINTIHKYTITSTSGNGVMPSEWSFKGSLNGSVWVYLDEQAGLYYWGDNETATFEITTPSGLDHYKFTFNEVDNMKISEIVLITTVS